MLKIEKIKVDYIVTTFFGVGYIPFAPGTFASIIAAIPIWFLPDTFKNLLFFIVTIIGFCSVPLIAKTEQTLGNDSPNIVIDEVLAVWLIFSSPLIKMSWINVLVGIVLFRILDIWKPWIIGRVNNKTGAKYVLLDDLIAAILVTIVLHLLLLL